MKINQDVAAFSFIVGSFFLLISPKLLDGNIFWIILIFIILGSLGALLFRIWCCWIPCLFILIGVLSSSYNARVIVHKALPWVDKYIVVFGFVDEVNAHLDPIPSTKNQNVSFSKRIHFQITRIGNILLNQPVPIEVTWPEKIKSTILAGQCWRLSLITRAIHSRLNEGSFDLQRFAASKGYFLRGTVKSAQLINDTPTFRQKIVSTIAAKLQDYSESGMMIALLFGERQNINREKKEILLYSGIAHLMAISGLHVLLVATFIFRVFRLVQWCLPISTLSVSFPLILSLLASLGYVVLAGMNPPALRAIAGLTGYVFLKLQKVEIGKLSLFLRLVALLIACDPLFVISDSFWLSCTAALSLLFLYHWVPVPSFQRCRFLFPIMGLLHLQIGIACLLLPIQIVLFNGISIGGLWTNLFAVPIMTFVIMPLLMCSLLCFFFHFDFFAHSLCMFADIFLGFITWFAESAMPFWCTTSYEYCGIAFFAWLLIIILRIRFWQHFIITSLLILFLMCGPFILKERPSWRVDMLDVGHGLAVVIRQGKDAIIYDSGQKYFSSSEAEKQIIPFLQWHNLKPHCLILSHQHSDHCGGLDALKKNYPNLRLMSSSSQLPNDFPCVKGKKWHWKQLQFEVLWPTELTDYAVNRHSCVIRVSDGKFSVLLTGDLEKKQERILLKEKRIIESTVLQMPHHGSATSSSQAFIKQIKPELTINSTARYNPWRLPSYKILNRYKEANIPVLSTHEYGQITVYFFHDHWHYETFRQHIKPRWYHDWFGALKKYG